MNRSGLLDRSRPLPVRMTAFAVGMAAVITAAPTHAGTATLRPVAMAEVRADAPDATFETENLWLNGNPDQARQLLLVFDLNQLDAELDDVRFSEATLRLVKAASSGRIGYQYKAVFTGITDNHDWDGRSPAPHGGSGETITWANAPKNDTDANGVIDEGTTPLGSVRLREGRPEVDLRNYLNWAVGNAPGVHDADRDDDGRISVWVHATHPVVYRYHGSGSEGPRLEVSYRAASAAVPATAEGGTRAATPHGMLCARADFGAFGDGQSDDTEALQKAFGSGQRVHLPRGVYRVTDTIRARARTHVHGDGGMWNPQNQSVIRYDGPEGGKVIHAEQAFNFQMEDLHIDGNKKAGIGVYWLYSTNEAGMEDVAIRHTLDHALFITRTWYAHFTRVVCRDNLGNGITLSRDADRHPGLAKGPVNFVNFIGCRGSHSGEDLAYDGRDNLETGYGFGSFGYNSMINVIGCAFEQNGGAGVYLGGHASTLLFQGNYIEYNSQGVIEREPEGWRSTPDRPALGYVANIIINTTNVREAVVFDTNYLHPVGGILIKGEAGGRNPIVFRRTLHPTVIWAEHDDWEFESRWQPEVVSQPGVFFKEDGDGKYVWGPGR